MHEQGCYSERVKADIVLFDKQIEQLSAALSDTLLIVTADHGMVDCEIIKEGTNFSCLDYIRIGVGFAKMPRAVFAACTFGVKLSFFLSGDLCYDIGKNNSGKGRSVVTTVLFLRVCMDISGSSTNSGISIVPTM